MKKIYRSIAAAALVCAALPASALSVFTLSTAAGSTYGTVSLTQVDADTVKINVRPATGYAFNDRNDLGVFNFNLDPSLQGNPTLTFNNPTVGYSLDDGVFQATEFGTLEYRIDCRAQVERSGVVTTTGCSGTVNSLTPSNALDFAVNLGGISEESFIANATGYYFTALMNNGTDRGFLVGSNSAPIPEPETYALMLAGLGVVGFMARRRMSA